MNILADVIIPGGHFGQVSEPIPGADAFVLMTLAILTFIFGAFTSAAIVLWCRKNRPSPHRQLLIELEDEAKPQAQKQSTDRHHDSPKSRSPWEREPDWWKR